MKTFDLNGDELAEGGYALLLCEILGIEDGGVHVRVKNSDHELLIGARHDEIFDGMVADSELTAYMIPCPGENDDEVRTCPME